MYKFKSELGDLTDINQFNQPIHLAGRNKSHLLNLLKTMLIIRGVENQIASLINDGFAKCPCHLSTGQEAIATGIAVALKKSDRVFSTHRSHAHFLALGGEVHALLAEVLGKSTGCSKGMGGSMHLLDKKNGFYGSVPIVGGTIPIALGAALAAKMDKKNDIAVCFFGDGAAEEGVLHESMNFASAHQLPILFVCENNLYSSHLDIKLRQPSDRIARFADAHHIKSRVVDGNDVVVVETAAQELIAHMRDSQNPTFLEAITYRWHGHVGPREDIDVGVRRKKEDLVGWKKRDSISRLAQAMIGNRLIERKEVENLELQVSQFIEQQKRVAINDPYPTVDNLLAHVYTE